MNTLFTGLVMLSLLTNCTLPLTEESHIIKKDAIYGNWLITEVKLRDISGYSKEEANSFVTKFIQIDLNHIYVMNDSSIEYSNFLKEDKEVDKDYKRMFNLDITSYTEYTFRTSLGYDEWIYLLSDEVMLYEVDGCIFKCKRMK